MCESDCVCVCLTLYLTTPPKGVNDVGECIFVLMGHRRYELSAKYTAGETVHVAAMTTVAYVPASHNINSIVLAYDAPFMQLAFDTLRTANSYAFACDSLYTQCPKAGVDTRAHNNLLSHGECVAKFEELPTFDDGPRFADSPGGGFDGNSASCRLLHSVLATFNTDHCAHLSFVPMADPFGKIKCQTSKRMRMTDFFDRTDLANFDTFKEAAGYDKGKGHKLVDRCFIYDSVRRPFPRPFWRTWRDDNPNAAMSPIEYISDEAWAWVMCCELPLAARGRWLLQIVVRQWFSDTFSDTCLVLRQP